MTTLVTGATGTVGSHVIRTLTEKGVKPRAFVRDQTKATGLQGQDVEVAIGDYGNPDSLPAALDGVEHLFLTCANHPSQVAWETAMVDAAAAAGVRRIVKLSALGAEIGSPVAFFDAHGRIEAHLRGAGVPSVVLQPAFKMSNLLAGAPTVKEADAFMLPGAGAKVAMIDPRDVAQFAVEVLTGDGHDGRAYQLTGPEAVTFDEVAEHLSTIIGRRIGFVAIPDGAAVEHMVGNGVPEWFATNVVTQFRLLRQGTQTQVQDVVKVLTGREPRSIAEFLRDNAGAFS